MADIVESQPFHGSMSAIKKTIVENPYYGKQAIILYFGSIGGRDTPNVCEWPIQPPNKMAKYEKAVVSLIKENFPEYPVVIGAVPPHAGTLFGFGSPIAGQSEVNPYKLATIAVESMTLKKENVESSILLGCPLDIAIVRYEMEHWCRAETLEEYFDAPRNVADITARVKNPNKVSLLLKERKAEWDKES